MVPLISFWSHTVCQGEWGFFWSSLSAAWCSSRICSWTVIIFPLYVSTWRHCSVSWSHLLTSTLMTHNSTLRLKALLFLIGIAAFPGWLLVLLILTPGCCEISWNWARTRQRCWSYPLLIDLILPYLPLLYVEKWYPVHLKLITLVLFLISPFPWFM